MIINLIIKENDMEEFICLLSQLERALDRGNLKCIIYTDFSGCIEDENRKELYRYGNYVEFLKIKQIILEKLTRENSDI